MSSWSEIIVLFDAFMVAAAGMSPRISLRYNEHLKLMVDVLLSEEKLSEPQTLDAFCLTPACIDAASKILRNMNPKADPCDNFYEFACGNYANSVGLVDSHLYSLPLHESLLQVDIRLQSIIEDIDETKVPKSFGNLKIAYKNCMKEKWMDDSKSQLEMRKNHALLAKTWRSLSVFKWNESLFDKFFVIPYILKFHEYSNVPNARYIVLTLIKKKQPIAFSYLKEGMDNEVVKDYLIFMKDIVAHLGGAKWQVSLDVPAILNMEIQLAQILFPGIKNHANKKRTKWTSFGELVKTYPNLHLNELLMENDSFMVKTKIDVKILQNLDEWISKKSKRALANWSAWQLTVEELDRLGPYVARRKNMLLRTVYGFVKRDPKWRQCIKQVRSQFPFVMDVLYYGQYLTESIVQESTEIVTNVKQQFIGFIRKAHWLSSSTKLVALEKVRAIKHNLGIYEDFMLNETSDSFHTGFKLSDGLLAENRANITKILNHPNIKVSRRANEENEAKFDFVKWQAHYVGGPNLLRVGAVSYTDNFYDALRPEALNYAGFGYWVGHELAHSLDDRERHFDAENRRHQWWDKESDKVYRERTQCLIQQYQRYGFDELGLRLKSFVTRNEDIADNVGTKAGYFAFDQLTKDKEPDKQLPGLDYSPKQMFWIGLASNWCAKYRPQTQRVFIYEDNHSMEKFRINVPLSNIPEFAHDFQCRPGSKMNPVEKCTLW